MGSGVSSSRKEQNRLAGIAKQCRRSSCVAARELTTSPSRRTLSVEARRQVALKRTFESICDDATECSMFKSFLHAEYDIALWDLWRSVEWFEALRAASGENREELLRLGGKFYDRYLAPDAKCFVEQVPSSLALAIAESLDEDEVPDCRDLNRVILRALCDEGMLQRFAAWLRTEDARREAATVENSLAKNASFRATIGSNRSSLDENFLRRASLCGDIRRGSIDPLLDDKASTSEKNNEYRESFRGSFGEHNGGRPNEYRESFRGSFDDNYPTPRDNEEEIPIKVKSRRRISFEGDAPEEPPTPTTPYVRRSVDFSYDDQDLRQRHANYVKRTNSVAPSPAPRRRERYEDFFRCGSGQFIKENLLKESFSKESFGDDNFQIPTSRASNKSFGLTSILLRQWEEDQSDGLGNLADHPMLSAPPVKRMGFRSNASRSSDASIGDASTPTRGDSTRWRAGNIR